MLSMSQETPRNIYDVRNRGRGSGDSYGFPSTHSSTSSMSSAGFSGYYGGSVDGSVSDYSAAGSDIESLSGRTLPRPQGLMSSQPPAPQSMMGSFSSRVSSSAQKKHKCKVCDKRFTRPSSLQTHMYSHTGEKRKRDISLYALKISNPQGHLFWVRITNYLDLPGKQHLDVKLKAVAVGSRLYQTSAVTRKSIKEGAKRPQTPVRTRTNLLEEAT